MNEKFASGRNLGKVKKALKQVEEDKKKLGMLLTEERNKQFINLNNTKVANIVPIP